MDIDIPRHFVRAEIFTFVVCRRHWTPTSWGPEQGTFCCLHDAGSVAMQFTETDHAGVDISICLQPPLYRVFDWSSNLVGTPGLKQYFTGPRFGWVGRIASLSRPLSMSLLESRYRF
jgi:hypothetical protein